MTHDPALAERIRAALAGRAGVTEKAMFGGVGFLLDGNLLVSASGRGGMLVRVGADGHEVALLSPHTKAMEMGGRGMKGYIVVAPTGVASAGAVASWIERAYKHVRTLAPKRDPRGRARAKVATRAKGAPAAASKSASGRASARVAPKKSKTAKPAKR